MSALDGQTGELYWDAEGPEEALALVLVHSLGCDSRMWEAQIEAFGSKRRMVWLDLPGHGRSGAAEGEYSIDDLAEDVLAVAAAAGLGEFDLCGVSLGGVIAQRIAIDRPTGLRRLVAGSTAPRVGTPQGWSDRIAAIEAEGLASLRESIVPRFVTEDLGERRPEARDLVYEMFDDVDETGYVGCCAALRDADLTGMVRQIEAPTLVVAGAEDVATPPEVMEPLHDAIEGSRMEVIEGAAHLPNIDRPEAFNRVVGEFLSYSP